MLGHDVILYAVVVHLKNDVFSISFPSPLYQGNTLLITNAITYPHCFLTAYKMTLRPSILAGMLDLKKQTYTT